MSRAYRIIRREERQTDLTESGELRIPFQWLPVGSSASRRDCLAKTLRRAGFQPFDGGWLRRDAECELSCDGDAGMMTVSVTRTHATRLHAEHHAILHDEDAEETVAFREAALAADVNRDLDQQSRNLREALKRAIHDWMEQNRALYESLIHGWQHEVTVELVRIEASRLGSVKSIQDDGREAVIVVQI